MFGGFGVGHADAFTFLSVRVFHCLFVRRLRFFVLIGLTKLWHILSRCFFTGTVFLTYVLLRIGLILPSWAVGTPFGAFASIQATSKLWLQFLGSAVFLSGVLWPTILLARLSFGGLLLTWLVIIAGNWLWLIFALSFLNTFSRL